MVGTVLDTSNDETIPLASSSIQSPTPSLNQILNQSPTDKNSTLSSSFPKIIDDPRGFYPVNQKLVIKLQPLQKTAQISTEIILKITNPSLIKEDTIQLNARNIDIKSVKINGLPVGDFIFDDYELTRLIKDKLPSGGEEDPLRFPNKLRNLLNENRGKEELKIKISEIGKKCNENEELKLQIDYEAPNIDFHLNCAEQEVVKYLQISSFAVGGMGRTWMPCFEQDAISWDIEYQIETIGLNSTQISHLNVASSGALCQQFFDNTEHSTKAFHFKLDIPTIPSLIGFCVGLFDMVRIPAAPFAVAFCPIGMSSKLSLMMEFFSRAFGFINWYLNCSFPYPSYYLMFTRDLLPMTDGKKISMANMSFFSSLTLFDSSIVDQNFATRLTICEAFAEQYFGVSLRGARWIVTGISNYLARLMLRVFHGHNDYIYNCKNDIERIVAHEQHGQPSLAEAPATFSNPQDEKWFERKSYLTIIILEHRLEKGVLQKILATLWSEFVNDLLEEGLGNMAFLKICKKVSGKDMRNFADQWILSSGCPVFSCSFTFNRKKSTIDVDFKQSTPGNTQRKVIGSLLIRVHEVDGVYDHSVHIDDFTHHFELPVHAKAKKIKKKKRILEVNPITGIGSAIAAHPAATQQQATDANGGGEGETKEEEEFVSPLSWIRLDPELEWIATLELHQPEYMLVEQLHHDKDVIAQYEAIQFLRRSPTDAVVEALEKVLNDQKCFYKVRIDAAMSLAACAPNPDTHLGGLKLISFYNKGFALQSTETVVVPVPKTNNFEALQPYFILTHVPIALGEIRTKNATLMELVGQILLNMLRFNDNASNIYSDNYHISRIISAMVRHLVGRRELGLSTDRLGREFLKELDRYAIVERIHPYYHNTVMVSVIKAWKDLFLLGITPSTVISDPQQLINEGNFITVRIAALEYLSSTCEELDEMIRVKLESIIVEPNRMSRQMVIEHLAGLSIRTIKCRALFSLDKTKDLLLNFILKNAAFDPINVTRLLTFIGKVIDGSPLDTLDTATGPKIALRINLSLPGPEQESTTITIPSTTTKTTAPTTTAEEEPDWLLEVSGEQGIKPRSGGGTLPTLRLSMAPLSSTLATRLQKLLQNIWDSYDSFPFRHPVDPSTVGYYEIIKSPMDLSTVQSRICSGIIVTISQFCADLRLIFDNCFYFNQPDSLISEQAKRLRTLAIKELKKAFPEYAKDARTLLISNEPIPILQEDLFPSSLSLQQQQLPSSLSSKRVLGKSKKKTKQRTFAAVDNNGTSSNTMSSTERMLKVLEKAKEHPYAFWFTAPVDPISLNIPQYFDIIQEPMDLGTLEERVRQDELAQKPEEFQRLLDLIFTNCTSFNSSNTVVHQNALEMRKAMGKLIKKYLPTNNSKSDNRDGIDNIEVERGGGGHDNDVVIKKRPVIKLNLAQIKDTDGQVPPTPETNITNSPSASPTKKVMLRLNIPQNATVKTLSKSDDFWMDNARKTLDSVCSHEYAIPFLEPVDPIALNIPSYPKIIKRPIDLSTIRSKLVAGQYEKASDMDKDFKLMFSNCYKFNGENAPISEAAKVLESFYDSLYGGERR